LYTSYAIYTVFAIVNVTTVCSLQKGPSCDVDGLNTAVGLKTEVGLSPLASPCFNHWVYGCFTHAGACNVVESRFTRTSSCHLLFVPFCTSSTSNRLSLEVSLPTETSYVPFFGRWAKCRLR